MKMLTATVMMLSLLAWGTVLAQAGSKSTSGAPRSASPQASPTIKITRSGSQPSAEAPAEHFTGSVRVDPLFSENPPAHVSGASVTFDPGARTAWHSHPLGQTLIVTAGKGWVQQWGGPIEEIRQGDVVWIPPGVKHWHGATAGTSMTHIAVQESVNGRSVEWMEKVSDEQYRNAQSTSGKVTGSTIEPATRQAIIGDFDCKLAELTDNGRSGDVCQHPGLSQQDRSLITVAVRVTLDRPE